MHMVGEIAEASRKAGEILKGIRELSGERVSAAVLLPLLQKAVCCKLMVGEQQEGNIRNLVILSIKLQDQRAGNLSDETIGRQIKKYDCHQTSLAAQKKVLLLMYLERELGFHMNDDEATSIETLEDLSNLAAAYLAKERCFQSS